jgi:hypothetical protein
MPERNRFPTIYPGMRVRVRHQKGAILPAELVEGQEVEVLKIENFVAHVRTDRGLDTAVCLKNIVPPDFVLIQGRWIRQDALH